MMGNFEFLPNVSPLKASNVNFPNAALFYTVERNGCEPAEYGVSVAFLQRHSLAQTISSEHLKKCAVQQDFFFFFFLD